MMKKNKAPWPHPKFHIKFRNRVEENAVKIPFYVLVGILILYFVFNVRDLLPYVELLIVVLIFRFLERDDILNYVYSGAIMAFTVYSVIGLTLSTNIPIVVVVSSSMQHDDPELTHYSWLSENLGYSRSYIDQWPFAKGFLVGDMPVVGGSNLYAVGDVIVYDAGQPAPIIHRIITVNQDGTYQTKGDNNAGQLPFEKNIDSDKIKGKVIFIIPKIGYIKIALIRLFGVFR